MKVIGSNRYKRVGSALSYVFAGISGYVTLSYFIPSVKSDVKKIKKLINKIDEIEEVNEVSSESLDQATDVVNKIEKDEDITINKVELAKKIEELKQEGIKRKKK